MSMQSPGQSAAEERDLLEAVRDCLESGATETLRELLAGAPPADVADALGDLDDEVLAQVFRLLDSETGAEVLDELGRADVVALAETAPHRVREAVEASEILFIAVGTPQDTDGSADMSFVLQVAREIAERMNESKIIVTKSTVPVGTASKVRAVMSGVT